MPKQIFGVASRNFRKRQHVGPDAYSVPNNTTDPET